MEHRPVSDTAQPRSIGELLDNTFRQYRTHFRFWFLVSACVLIPYLVLNSIFTYHSVDELKTFLNALMTEASHPNTTGNPFQALQGMQTQPAPHAIYMVWFMALIQIFIVTPLLYGTLLHFVTELQLFGRQSAIDEAFSVSVKRLFPMALTIIVLGLMGSIGILIVTLVDILIGAGTAATHNTALIVVAIIVITVGMLVLIAWLFIKLAFVPSSVLEEGKMVFAAIGRSWVLTRRNFWRTLGFFLLMYVIIGFLEGGLNASIAVLVRNSVVVVVLTNIVSLFTTPLLLLALANMYTDLRIRTDSPDLHHWLGAAGEGNNGTTQE